MYKVDKKKYPIPPPQLPPGRYPWDNMKVGQSFLVTDKKYHQVNCAVLVTNKRKAPRKWRARVVTEGVRVWRLA